MKNADLILVYDTGTTAVKCAVFDPGGLELVSCSKQYKTHYPVPGRAEQHAEDFWDAAVEGTRTLLSAGRFQPAAICAIGLSGHMNGCLAVGDDGESLFPELIHADARSGQECAQILQCGSQSESYRVTGNRVDVHLSLPKIMWIRNHQPDVYRRTRSFINAKDYLRFKLTGVPHQTDFSDASLTAALNIGSGTWDTEYLSALGIDPEKFPEIHRSTEVAGTLTGSSASILGLRPGVPVVFGGGDAACATRGAGVKDSSQAYIHIGSSAWVSTLSEQPLFESRMRMQNFFDLDGVGYNVCGTVQSAGIAADWALALVSSPGRSGRAEPYRGYEGLDKLIAAVPPGSDGVLFAPYLMGERTPHWDSSARGAFVGFSLSHGKGALVRAVLEGVGFALKSVLEIYKEFDFPIEVFSLLGGGATIPAWSTILASILGTTLKLHPSPTTATSLGAAMAAGVGVGLFPTLDEATRIVSFDRVVQPDRDDSARYRDIYPVSARLYDRLKPVYDDITHIRRREEP